MTMPDSPKKPKIDIMVRSKLSSQWPKIAPTRPKGITLMTASGQTYERSTQARIM